MEEVYRATAEEIEAGRPCVLVTVIEAGGHTPAKPGAKLLLRRDGSSFGTVGGGALERLCIERAAVLLAAGGSAVQRYLLDEDSAVEQAAGRGARLSSDAETAVAAPMACGGTVTVFFETVGNLPEICLFGAGHIGRALTRHLAPLGARLRMVDDRPDLLAEIPDQPRLSKQALSLPLPETLAPAESFVVVATHSHDLDYEIVRTLISRTDPPRYLGVVASRRKLKLFLTRLQKDLGDGFDRSRLFAPCGLNIASRDPEEIALSIAAEIVAIKNGSDRIIHMRELQDTT